MSTTVTQTLAPDAREAYRQAVQRGARGVVEPHRREDESGSIELASIAT